MIHHYTTSIHDRTGTYRSVPGAGAHPSPSWLAARGWYEVADRPDPPTADGWTWRAADPPYALEDGVSVPRGEWVETPPAEPTPADAARADYVAMLAQLKLEPGATAADIETAVAAIADPDARQDAGLRLAAVALAVLNRGGTL